MILLDSDILMLDLRYQRDPKYPINRQVLQYIQAGQLAVGITVQALLETIGNLSFNVPFVQVSQLPQRLAGQYGLSVLPDMGQFPSYANCTIQELVTQIGRKMGLGDAVQAIQIARFAAWANCLLTWNARHFTGKIAVPVLTPQEWLQQQAGPTP